MRSFVVVLVLTIVAACQRAESPPAPESAPSTTVVAAAPAPAVEPGGSCGGACGGSCGGSCGGGEIAAEPEPVAVPADAVWTTLKVGGMHCGGCARRVRGALAGVDGIYAVQVDLAQQTVAVATPPGRDARALAQPRIDALGYRVQE